MNNNLFIYHEIDLTPTTEVPDIQLINTIYLPKNFLK